MALMKQLQADIDAIVDAAGRLAATFNDDLNGEKTFHHLLSSIDEHIAELRKILPPPKAADGSTLYEVTATVRWRTKDDHDTIARGLQKDIEGGIKYPFRSFIQQHNAVAIFTTRKS